MSLLERIKIEAGQSWKPSTNAPNRHVISISIVDNIEKVLYGHGGNNSRNIISLRQFQEWVHRSNATLVGEDDMTRISFSAGQYWVPSSNGWARKITHVTELDITYEYFRQGTKYTKTCARDSFVKWKFNSGAKVING